MDPKTHQGLALLADAVEQRLAALGITVPELSRRGGPDRNTTHLLLKRARTVKRSTCVSLDKGLGWPLGLAKKVYDLLEPPPDPRAWLDEALERDRAVASVKSLRRKIAAARNHLDSADKEIDAILNNLDGGHNSGKRSS